MCLVKRRLSENKRLTGIISYPPDSVLDEVMLAGVLGCSVEVAKRLLAEPGGVKGRRVGRGGWRLTWRSVIKYLEGN